MEDCPMNEAFDKVTLSFFGCCDYEGSWTPGEPFPSGWGRESEARENGYVCASEFDRVLAALNEAKAEISKLSTRMDQLLASETEAVEALARMRELPDSDKTGHNFSISDGEFDEVFIKNAFVHIERMDEMCFWIGIDSPTHHSLHIRTGVDSGSWWFSIEQDALDGGHRYLNVDRKLLPINRENKCPKCHKPMWGEGCNPITGDRFFSHCNNRDAGKCDFKIVIPPASPEFTPKS